MKVRALLLSLVTVAILLLPGCGSVSARKVIALDQFHRIFVEQRLNDNARLHEMFVAELRQLGFDASSGPLTMMPDKTDALLTYDARWQWDFKTYLIELNLEVHTVYARKKLADARYYQPTLKTKTPAEVVHAMVQALFVKS